MHSAITPPKVNQFGSYLEHSEYIVGGWSHLYCCYDHRTFTATVAVGYHWTDTAIVVFHSVLAGLSGRCFLTSAAQSSDIHLNAASFNFKNVNARRVSRHSPVSHNPSLPRHECFPIHKRQHCRDSRDNLGTVLSETVTTVLLNALLPSRAMSN